jgi:hypothetical protein
MKANLMATEPVSSGIFAGLIWKLGLMAVVGAVGGAIMAAFDPPETRKGLFLQATVAGTGSLVFGDVAHAAATLYLPFASGTTLIPSYFLVGALSWGVLGALAKFRKLVSEKAAGAVAKKLGVDE